MDDLPLDRCHRLKLLPLARLANLVGHPQGESLESRLAMMGRLEENYRLPLVQMKKENRAKLEKIAAEVGLLQGHAAVK